MSGVICDIGEGQEGSEISNVDGFGDGGTDQETGGRTGGVRVNDVEILFGSGEDGQAEEREHRRDSTGQTF